MRALAWGRLLVGIVLYLALDWCAGLGPWFVVNARRLDVRLDAWRHQLKRRDDVVAIASQKVWDAVEVGATGGTFAVPYLDEIDIAKLARAIDNAGCYCIVNTRGVNWRRRDRYPAGHAGALLSLAAFAPADRDPWSDAIANIDGEGEK